MYRPISLFVIFALFLSLLASVRPTFAQGALPPVAPGNGAPDGGGAGGGAGGEDPDPGDLPPEEPPLDDPPAQLQPQAPLAPGQLPNPPVGFGKATEPPATQGQGAGKPDAPQGYGAQRRSLAEIRLRGALSDFGIDDPAKQDAVIAYLAEDEKAKDGIKLAARHLMTGISRNYEADKMANLLAIYKSAIEADKLRRAIAQTALDAKIGYSLNPRLESALYLFGILGDGQPMAMSQRNNKQGGGNQPGGMAGAPGGGLPGFGPNRGGVWMGAVIGVPPGGNGTGMPRPFGAGSVFGAPNNRAAETPQAGIVYGTVTDRGEGWIEVKMGGAASERYTPFWTAPANGGPGGYDKAVLEAMSNCKVGDSIRLEWVWSERRRIVKLDPWVTNAPRTDPPRTDPPKNEPPVPPAGTAPATPLP